MIIPTNMSNNNDSNLTKLRNHNFYDAVYDALSYTKFKEHPIPKSKISNHSYVLKIILQSEFVIEITDEKQKLITKKGLHKYYKLSMKGDEYIKLYEKIQELLKRKNEL